MIKRFYILLLAIVASVGMSWATENSIVINGTPQVGDNSISLTYYFDPANVPGITGYAPTLKVKCVTDNIWDEEWLSLSEISSGTTTITLNKLGSFQEGKSYDVCFAYYNGSWVDDVFQSFTPAAPTPAVIDLATITSDYVIPDGATLTGTLGTNVKLTIAAGATVTLNGVDINSSGTWTGGDYAGITCPGNATIILADGTVNRIKGFLNGNSAIHIKPNYTLTIEGDGTLYASTQGGAAAIGCGYSDSGGSRNGGNIVINGGTIYANGGSLAAGIGGGGRATIGNITINGGIIYAVGGGTGAGIGGGQSKSNSWKSICGNITISSNVKYLKATKGSGAAHSIGMGSSSYSVCGTVTIPGGATGYVSTSPYVYCNPDYVIELINAIPQPVVYTDECKAAIDEARAMYTALTDDQKTSVTNYSTLTDAEAAYAALLVEDKIAAIGTVELTAESKALIDAARTAYDALSDEAKALVTNYSTLTDAETAYAALIQAGADAVKDKIAAIPQPVELKLSVYDKVLDARAAYDALTADQKLLVTNYQTLLDAEAAFDAIGGGGGLPTVVVIYKSEFTSTGVTKEGVNLALSNGSMTADDMLAMDGSFEFSTSLGKFTNITIETDVNIMNISEGASTSAGWPTGTNLGTSAAWTGNSESVLIDCMVAGNAITITCTVAPASVIADAIAARDLINAIPDPVTLDDACVKAIKDARAAVDALGENAKLIDAADMAKLTDAEQALKDLNQAEADKVIAKINNIPLPVELKLATRDSIESARAAYDALTADQKALVSNYDVLTAAEATMATLNPGGGAPSTELQGDGSTENPYLIGGLEAWNAFADAVAAGVKPANAKLTNNIEGVTRMVGNNTNYYTGVFDGNGFTITMNIETNLDSAGLFRCAKEATFMNLNLEGTLNTSRKFAGSLVGAQLTSNTLVIKNVCSSVAMTLSLNDDLTSGGIVGLRRSTMQITDCLFKGSMTSTGSGNMCGGIVGYSSSNLTLVRVIQAGTYNLNTSSYDGVFVRNNDDYLNAQDCYYINGVGGQSTCAAATQITTDQLNTQTYVDLLQTGKEETYWVLKDGVLVWNHHEASSPSPLDSAQAVKDLIEAIPAEITTDDACVKAIEDARAAYDALSEATKGALDDATVAKLTDAETALAALNQAEADKVVAKINNIPTPVELKLATRDSIQNARAAYDALNAAQQALVSNYQTLLDAEAALDELNKGGSIPMDIVWDGNTGIENVSPTTTSPAYEGMTVTVGQGSSFSTYQSRLYFTFYSQPNGGFIFANENGTNITKVVIESTTALTSTMTEVDRMGSGWVISNENKTATWTGNADSVSIWKGQSFTNYWVVDTITFTVNGVGATPLDSAQHVKDLIDAIPTPVEYPTSGPAIAAALVAYNQLSDAAKGALDDADVQKMTDAAAQYAALDAIAAIEAIPAEIVYDPAVKAAIETAREKYDALSDASKALVDDEVVAKLTNAEQAWADLVALIEHNVSYIGKDGELKNEKVALLHIPNPAPEFNGHEFVRWDVKAGDFLEEGLCIKAVYTPIITTQPAAYDTLVYNGTAQTLIEAGVASDGHIEYRLNEGDWSAELPKADMAAAYVVDYKLVREGHEDYMAGSVTAVIAKAPVTYVAPQAYDTLAYNYNTQVLVTAGQTNDGTIEYSLDPNLLDSWSADLPQAMNAGTYDVYFRVQGDLNHFDSIAPAPVAVTIAKRDIVITAPVAYDTLVYNSLTQALAAAGSADFGTMEYTLTPDNGEGWSADLPQAMNAGTYAIYYRVQGDNNHNDYPAHSIAVTIAQAPLTITAENKEVIYGDAAPEFTATYSGWMGQDDATVISNLQITSTYAAGSSVGTYDIVPSGATAQNYAITFANGKLTVGKADVSVSGAEVHTAKFADGHAVAEVTNQGTLNGIKLNDAIAHVTTAAFSSADVAEHLTITLFYELTGDAALLKNYNLMPTSEVYTNEGVIIEPMLPNDEHQPEEDEQVVVHEGIDVYMYGYCEGDSVGMRYHLNSGNPDEYKIEFEDSHFTDVDWTKLDITGRDGIIYISVPVDMPTGDYKMTVYFRDSRFDWLESQAFNATFHVNLPETYVRPLFGNTIVLVDTCECFTDIQWYYRKDASEPWQIIPGATGHYYHAEGNLTGEYFVKAKMNGVETYTCGQEDMETLYGADNKSKAKVSAYPNPVIDNTNVTIENSEDWEHNLRIVNLMGVEMNSTIFEGDHTVVEMSGYPQGNYMISVDGIMVKVLKQ